MSDTAKKNRYHSKLKCCYYAKATYDETAKKINYAAPVRIKDSVAISLSKKGDPIIVRVDGREDFLGNDKQGYDGDLEALRFPESFETDCLGYKKNTDGTIDEYDNLDSSPFALLFEFEGDKKAVRHCLFWCYATNPNIEGDNPDSKEPKNEKIAIYSRPRPTDGKIKTKTGDDITDEIYNSWYTAVPGQDNGE